MKNKQSWLVFVLLLAFGMLLVACGGADETPDAEEPATQEEAAQEEAAQEETMEETMGEATLRWRTRPDNQAEIDVYQSVNDAIDAANDDLTLVYEPGGSESSSYQDVLKTELASGTAPDVFWIPGTDIADFATRGLLLDMRTMADATDGYADADFYPGPMFHMTFNPETGNTGETLWGLPRDVSTFALYLNLDLLAESGAPDPRELSANGEWDWDAFVEVGSAINGLGDDIFGYGQSGWWGPYGYWLNAAGGGFFNEDRTACGLDSAESLAGLEFEQRLYTEFDIAIPYGEDPEPPFLAGKVGMFQNGRWATPGARASANFNWDVVELPDGPAGPSNWLFWGGYVVNANTENPAAAWKLVQELTTAETQGMISELGANIPSRVSQDALDAFLTFTPPENNQAFLNGLARNPATEGPLWAGSWPEYDAVMGPAVTAVLNGEQSVEEFAGYICDEANKTFAAAPVAAEPAMEEEPMEEVTLRWRTRPDNQAEIDVYQSVNDAIDAGSESLTLVYEPGGSESSSYQDVLKTELASGTAPDVFWIPGTDIADFATRGLLLDMRTMADATDGYADADFYPGPMFHMTFNPETGNTGETLWGLPRDVSTFGLYLNLDLLAESGAPDPRELSANGEWNWDTFVEVAMAIDGLGDDIFGYGQSGWWGPYGYWLNAAGGGFFNEDRTACGLDSAESLAGLEFEQRLYTEFDIAIPYGEDPEPPFLAGKVGMFQNGRWATPGARASANFNWDVVELPDGPAGPSNWLFWGAYVVNANTEHPEAAWELVQQLTTAETQGMISELGANIPSRVSQDALDAFLTFTPPENNQAFLNGLARNPATEGPLWAGSWPEYDAVMGPAVTAVLNGEQSVEEFAGYICDEANKTFNP